MASRPILTFFPLFFLAGALLLLFFVILAGVTDHNPLNRIFFLSASNSPLTNAPTSDSGMAHYTLWGLCGATNSGHNQNCQPHHAAYAVSSSGGPVTGNWFYYMSRFQFAFYLITIAFAALAFFTGLLALCSRLGGAISAVLTALALVFSTAVSIIMTILYVRARDHFRSAGYAAHVGVKAFAFTWTIWVLLLLSLILFSLAACIPSNRERSWRQKRVVEEPAYVVEDHESQRPVMVERSSFTRERPVVDRPVAERLPTAVSSVRPATNVNRGLEDELVLNLPVTGQAQRY
ncbi:Eisosomes component [Saitoella coloradoensis]